jgi:hypothetical protein
MVWNGIASVPAVGFWGTLLLGASLAVVARRVLLHRARPRTLGIGILVLALILPVSGALAALPFTFVNGHVADATQVNANFATLSTVYMNRNFQAQSLATFPGVTTATLTLPPGIYVLHAKFRYRGTGSAVQTAGCAFQGMGIGGLDASQNNVPIGGEQSGQVDAYMMDLVQKNLGDPPDVHVQCFGPPDVQIINTQLVAVPAPSLTIQP